MALATGGANLTTLDAALKETWTESRLAEQLYQGNPLLDKVKKYKSTQVGQQAVTPIHTGRNWGYTPLGAAGGTLSAAGTQALAQATWQYTHHNMQVQIQGSAIDGTRGDALSVAEVVDLEISGAIDDLNRQLTRQLFMDGDALVSKTGVTTTSATVQLTPISGLNALERGWIAPGALVMIGTTGSEDSLTSAFTLAQRTVSAVSESAQTMTLGTTLSTAGTDTVPVNYVSLYKTRSGATSLEMNGLGNIVSTSSTLGGLTTASNPVWASPSVDTTSQALTLPLMYAQSRKVFQKIGKEPNWVVSSPKQVEAAYKLLQSQVRFGADDVAAGNVTGTSINGMQLVRMPDCKNEDMWFLTTDDLLLISAGDPYWQNRVTGGNILTWIQDSDSYGGKITVRMNLGARRRNSHAALRGLT